MMSDGTSVSTLAQPGQPSVLLYCRTCLEVRHLTSYDAVPQYRIQGDEVEEEADQERVAFFQRHEGHSLTTLKRKKDRFWADRPLWDPQRTAYEEVTDGRETFLLKSWRTDINEPRQYALLRGSLAMTTDVMLPEEPLQSALTRDFTCSAAQLASLTRILQRAVATLSPEELIPAYCAADDPQLSFAYLTEHHLRMLTRGCDEAGFSVEKERLWDFFVRNREAEELTVEMRHYCQPHFG